MQLFKINTQINFGEALCDDKQGDEAKQQKWECMQNKMPPEISGPVSACQQQLAGGQAVTDYINTLCQNKDKIKELLSCIVEQLVNGNPITKEALKSSADSIKECLSSE
ncbi:uncharacterized protein LOC111619812 [Centruroides sculpturatus]|uniref:uncharacterized protein LOC111619812 n=1 Tax=Centruroides sculpturatus TaxID=218467 RepID=UPI000C6E0295|nr:uncharacterized protein LOC111619812 [Centruroides sculpturatus]